MVKHIPCEVCAHSVGGVDCGQNIEKECREGGGYESFKPHELAMLDKKDIELYINALEKTNDRLMGIVTERNAEIEELEKELEAYKPGKLERTMQWSVTVLAWACLGVLLWRVAEQLGWLV